MKKNLLNFKSTMNNVILSRGVKDSDFFSPMIRNKNLNKKLTGRTLEFDLNKHKVVTSTVIEKKSFDSVENSNSFTFLPDFTSTPTHKIQKTSTPKSGKKMSKRNKCLDRCNCYCNSTFKEDVDVSMVFFGTKLDRHEKKNYLVKDKFYRKIKTVKKTTYITRMKEEYYQNFYLENSNKYTRFNLNDFPRPSNRQSNFKFNTYDLYYSEENLQEVKLKFFKKYLKSKKMKRLSKCGELMINDRTKCLCI